MATGFADSSSFLKLRTALEKEAEAYKKYGALLKQEQESVVAGRSEETEQCATKRAELLEQLRELHEQRLQIVRAMGEADDQRLSDIIRKKFPRPQAKELLLKVVQLRRIVLQSRRSTSELSQVIDFSQRLISGFISILASATQSVFRSYTQHAKMRESYHSANPHSVTGRRV